MRVPGLMQDDGLVHRHIHSGNRVGLHMRELCVYYVGGLYT